MTKTKAAAVMQAADKARRTEQRVNDARRALEKAEKARDRAELAYLKLAEEAFAGLRQRTGSESQEGREQPVE